MRLYHGSKSGTIAAAIVPVFPAGARVAFYGDSITKNGGAILRVAAQYRAAFPDAGVRFFNVGCSGGGVESAELYFDGWLVPFRPTHVVLGFGVNDAGPLRLDSSAADMADEAERLRTVAETFRARYAALVDRVEALGAKVVLRTPTPFEGAADGKDRESQAATNDAHRRVADQIRAVAAERKLPLVDDFARMSELIAAGEALFNPDHVHPTDYGQWRMAETFLAAQGISCAPYRLRGETAASAGLAEWDPLSVRLAEVHSVEWLVVRDETLDTAAKLEKVRDWLAREGAKPGTNPYIVRVAREYLQYKPQEAEMRARLQ
ncbi:MAG: hypothetical protein IJP66_06340 [Kiritimatiellae bacterium]|nr:hypothetical protein [Kiritimatiellia bacterium]